MMIWVIDVKIALRRHGNVEEAVARELVQHVIEERHAGRDFGMSGAVEIQRERNLRFARGAFDFRGAWACHGPVNAARRRAAHRSRRAYPP